MARETRLLDRWGNPVERKALSHEVAAPTIGGVRSPLSGYPADGLDPLRLAAIMRDADQGDPIRYLELAEAIEERDPHYLGVIATRKRSVSQIEVTVEAASDDARDIAMADMVRDWLKRDELTEEIFHILDCIGKGVSFTEIVWETSEGQYRPERLIWRDPRHFRYDRRDLSTPRMIDADGLERPLPAFRFIFARIAAKSGLPLRSGLARVAAWGWMFKAYTLRDWAIFTQTYGQPIRLGRWHEGASEEDKATLFRAVSNIAGDCAAIISDRMSMEFVEAKNVGASTDHYERRADWFDRQISKAVLGQTTSTDAIAGGHAVSREHRQVQEDIETADARALAAILNRDLVRPWVDLEYGPQARYPRLVIARPRLEDLKGMAEALAALVPLGLRVGMSEVRDRLGFADPDASEAVLGAPDPVEGGVADPDSEFKRFSGEFKRGQGTAGIGVALNAQGAPAPLPAPQEDGGVARDPVSALAGRLEAEATPAIETMLSRIEAMVEAAGSLDELREMLLAGFDQIDEAELARVLGPALVSAWSAGRVGVEEEAG